MRDNTQLKNFILKKGGRTETLKCRLQRIMFCRGLVVVVSTHKQSTICLFRVPQCKTASIALIH